MVVPKSIAEDDSLLSPSQVAEELGVHRSTVHNWISSGLLTSEKHGAFHAVSRSELKRFSQLYEIDNSPEPAPKRNT